MRKVNRFTCILHTLTSQSITDISNMISLEILCQLGNSCTGTINNMQVRHIYAPFTWANIFPNVISLHILVFSCFLDNKSHYPVQIVANTSKKTALV